MAVKIKLLCSTKYKGKIIFPGIHDVTKKKAYEMVKMGKAKPVNEDEKSLDNKSDSLQAGELEKIQAEQHNKEIDIDGKSAEALADEIELAKELDLQE